MTDKKMLPVMVSFSIMFPTTHAEKTTEDIVLWDVLLEPYHIQNS